MASIFFANRFPGAEIIAVEPEKRNFQILKKNIAPYENIKAVHGAIWNENKSIELLDPGMGSRAFMTTDESGGSQNTFKHQVQGQRMKFTETMGC